MSDALPTPEEMDANFNRIAEECAKKALDGHFQTVWNMIVCMAGNEIGTEGVCVCLNEHSTRAIFDAGYSAAGNGIGLPRMMVSSRALTPPVEKKEEPDLTDEALNGLARKICKDLELSNDLRPEENKWLHISQILRQHFGG